MELEWARTRNGAERYSPAKPELARSEESFFPEEEGRRGILSSFFFSPSDLRPRSRPKQTLATGIGTPHTHAKRTSAP